MLSVIWSWFCMFQAAAVVVAKLSEQSTENNIVSQLRSLYVKQDDPEKVKKEHLLTEINNNLEKLGVDTNRLILTVANSIWCYFICTSEEQLKQLRRHFESGLMRNVLMKMFTLLANNGDIVMTHPLKWDSRDYHKSLQEVCRLIALAQ